MREILTVLAYTFRENGRKPTLIISTVIIMLLTAVIMILPGLITNSAKSNTSSGTDQQVITTANKDFYVVDVYNVFEQDTSLLKKVFPDCNFQMKTASDVGSIIARVKDDENVFLLVLGRKNGQPTFDYYFKQLTVGPDPDTLEPLIKSMYTASLLKSAGVNPGVASKILALPSITPKEMGKGYFKSVISSALIIFVLFFSIYFFGHGIAMSVAAEKTSRVMEILITSTKPAHIIIGKTVAMGLLGLSQLVLILSTGIITYRLFFPKDFRILGQSIDFSAFTPLAIVMIVLYFILGYFLYAMLNAVAGASVSKTEDVNSAIMPVSMISLIAFYASYFPSTIPHSGNLSAITSFIPFTSPFSMPGRLLTATVSPFELVASIVLLMATIVLLSWICIRIYSGAILQYGNRLKLTDLFSLAKSR